MFLDNCGFHLFVAYKFSIIRKQLLLLSPLKQNYSTLCTCPRHCPSLLEFLSPTCILENIKSVSGRKAKFLHILYYITLKYFAKRENLFSWSVLYVYSGVQTSNVDWHTCWGVSLHFLLAQAKYRSRISFRPDCLHTNTSQFIIYQLSHLSTPYVMRQGRSSQISCKI
jgi:hypothetical protein